MYHYGEALAANVYIRYHDSKCTSGKVNIMLYEPFIAGCKLGRRYGLWLLKIFRKKTYSLKWHTWSRRSCTIKRLHIRFVITERGSMTALLIPATYGIRYE